ncbi:MAG: S24 family peptidase [Mariniphaga sp.]
MEKIRIANQAHIDLTKEQFLPTIFSGMNTLERRQNLGFCIHFYGDSMFPVYMSGDYITLEKVEDMSFIQFGETYLIVTNSEANDMRLVRIIKKHPNPKLISLISTNPTFDEMELPKSVVVELYIVTGSIRKTHF